MAYFKSFLDYIMIVFIDNIFVDSKIKKENIVHLRIVLGILNENQLYAKFLIYVFWMSSVAFLWQYFMKKGDYISQ